ncbi:MAG: response regulator [Methylovulum sp.]|nr:response regulator [Methylovulum sp.]
MAINSALRADYADNTILIIDDQPENLTVIGELLRPFYRIRAANSGAVALRVAASPPLPDLILLDVMMPTMDGYEVLEKLKENPVTANIPVIFVTALGAENDEERGLKLGAVDYITKPIKPIVLLARVRTQLGLKRTHDWLADQNAFLEAEIMRRMHDNLLIQDASLGILAGLAETRDSDTGNHIFRTQTYVGILGKQLQKSYATELTDAQLAMIVNAAPLHDIGKIGIPDHILLKPGKLTKKEFEIMKTHARLGGLAIEKAIQRTLKQHGLPQDQRDLPALDFLNVAREIATYHHEKWDGSGYPDGLAGNAIPLSARLMALADVFDALVSARIYKPALPFDKVYGIILAGQGRHFQAEIVAAFIACYHDFTEIATHYQDEAINV